MARTAVVKAFITGSPNPERLRQQIVDRANQVAPHRMAVQVDAEAVLLAIAFRSRSDAESFEIWVMERFGATVHGRVSFHVCSHALGTEPDSEWTSCRRDTTAELRERTG